MDSGKNNLIPPSDFEQRPAPHVASTPRGRLNVHEQADHAANTTTFLSTSSQPANFGFPTHTERYVNEALTRQAVQIAELHEEVRRLEAEKLRDKLMCENELSLQKTHYETRIATLQEEKTALREIIERGERDTQTRYEAECARLRHRIEELDSSLADSKAQAHSEISRLQSTLSEVRTEFDDVKRALREAESYIEDAHERYAAVTKWEAERKAVEQRMRDVECRASSAEKERMVIETRLAALRDALRIHERALCDSAAPVLNIAATSGNSPFGLALGGAELTPERAARAASDLITRWREAAFEQLVRLREMEAAYRSELHEMTQREGEASRREQVARAQLEAASRALETDRSEIDMLRDRLSASSEKVKQLDEKNSALDAALCAARNELQNTVQAISERVGVFHGSFIEGLRRFEQSTRARIGVIETEKLFRVQNRLRLVADSNRELQSRLAEAERSWQNERAAFERLIAEQHDRENNLQAELDELKRSNSHKVSQLELRTANALNELDTLRSDTEAARAQLAAVATERDQLDAAYAKAQERIAQFERAFDRLVDEKVHESLRDIESRHADLQSEHRELKREHAKTIVSLRQVERALDREKEIFDQQRLQTEEDYGRQIETLRAQLRTAEKDRNMLLSSVKQESLLRKLKQARPAPAELLIGDDDEDFHKQVMVTSSKLGSPTRLPPAGNFASTVSADRVRVQSLIDSVKQLSKQLDDD